MPATSSTPRSSASGSASRRFRYSGPDLRVSDAERHEVADLLSRHYADGRLDQAEFDERAGRAMNAKTRADFRDLFADLPDLGEPPTTDAARAAARQRQRQRPRLLHVAGLVVLVLITLALLNGMWWFHMPWLLIGVLAFLLLWSRSSRHHRP
jgi:hypothetical protein